MAGFCGLPFYQYSCTRPKRRLQSLLYLVCHTFRTTGHYGGDNMPDNVALLIDLENFYLARENLSDRYDHRAFRSDLELLTTFVLQEVDKHRLIVQRAYANFKVSRKDGDRRDYYLEGIPDHLMNCGIEPVQVFRFPKGTNKNAVDMRIAMDATSLVSTRSPVQQFILVTGDSDFIPVILELKRHGPRVTVIGVKGSTSDLFERYCDKLPGIPSGIEPIHKVLVDLAARHGRIKFAAIKPLLERQLNRPFALTTASTASAHDTTLYLDLLKETTPRIHIVRKSDWHKITEMVYQHLARSPDAKPPTFYYRKLQDQLVEQAKERGISVPELKVSSVMHQLFNAGCFVSNVTEGPESETMFSWDESASLHPELSSLDHIQVQARRHLIELLLSRGKARDPAFSIDPKVLATLLCDSSPTRGDVEQMKQSIDGLLGKQEISTLP